MKYFVRIGLLILGANAFGQRPNIDTLFRVSIANPMFIQQAPKVLVDEAHNNIHGKEGGLFSFTRMMEEDGAVVSSNDSLFTEKLLTRYDVLIIVNALHDSNVQNWATPNPSAFSNQEIDAVEKFVKNGGSLLLVADHMPCGGAVQNLAQCFGIEWSNSFVMQNGNKWPPSTFKRSNSTLLDSPVTEDTSYGKRVSLVASFTGSAFKVPEEAEPFMIFEESHRILFPKEAWRFSKKTKNESAKGWSQGACLEYGLGKIVLLGEAAMITAQLRGKTEIGMNSIDAPENPQLALNIFRYLAAN